MSRRLKELYNGFLDLLFPKLCPVCLETSVEGADSICSGCQKGIRKLVEPVCACCGMEVYSSSGDKHLCGACIRQPPPFELARSVYSYDEELRTLITRLKYQKDTSVVKALGGLMRKGDLSCYHSCDYIIPVPLHIKRLRERGFNQALLLAKACFGPEEGRICTSILRRREHTVPQVLLDAKARRHSLKGAFELMNSADIQGKSICLVDDVYTTGTTVSRCSSELLRGGAERVLVLTLARVKSGRFGRGRV